MTGTKQEKQRIGIVGAGKMGVNMARRLKDCHYPISAIFDINAKTAESVAKELDAKACNRLSEVTALSDVIITIVSDDEAMKIIYEQPEDNLFINAGGKLFLNCATISPSIHIRLAEKAKEVGCDILETPMASSIPQAREGKLFLICAGSQSVYEANLTLLNALSASVVFTGKPGTAASLKALVNMVMNINTAALAEGLGLAEAIGLDLELVQKVFAQTGANSRVLETDGADMQNREHDTYFSAAHAAKDCRIALALGQANKLPLVVATATTKQYEAMQSAGLGNLDKSGISELTFKDRMPGILTPQ